MVPPPLVLTVLTSGSWTLFNRSTVVKGTWAGDPDQALGIWPTGTILYHPAGYMSANMMSTNSSQRPTTVNLPGRKTDSQHDWYLIGFHTFAYAGPFSFTGRNEVEGKLQGELQHGPLTVCNIPNVVGTKQLRNFTLSREGEDGKGEWILKLYTHNDTQPSDSTLLWRRTPRRIIEGAGL